MTTESDKARGHRTYTTHGVAVAFARQGVAIETISRALVVGDVQVMSSCRRAIAEGDLLAMPPEKSSDTRGALQVEIAHLRDELEKKTELLRETRRAQEFDLMDFAGVAALTPRESRLLAALVRYGRVTKDRLFHAVYGNLLTQDQPCPKIIDVFVCKIRHKLRPHGIEIETVWGYGYSLNAENAAKIRALAGLPIVESPALMATQADMVAA